MDDYAEKQSNFWGAPQKNSNKIGFSFDFLYLCTNTNH